MTETLLSNEPLLRLSAFAAVLAAMVAWEVLAPRREQRIGRGIRWPGNLGVVEEAVGEARAEVER